MNQFKIVFSCQILSPCVAQVVKKKKIHKCPQANSVNGIKAGHSGHVYSADGIRVSIQTALLNAADFSAQAGQWEC